MIRGYAGRVLDIDLAAQTAAYRPLDEELARLYIGGKGYGTHSQIAGLVSRDLGVGSRALIIYDHVAAQSGQGQHSGATDARSTSGHNRRFSS